MNRTLKIFATFCLLSGTAYAAPTVATGQKTAGAQNMSNAIRKLRTQHVPQLEATLEERGLPKSVVKAPSKILNGAVNGPLKDRLELGLTGEPVIQQQAYTSVEARGNAASKTDARVFISSTAGNIAGVAPIQHIQATADNSPPTPTGRPYRDPRAGIQITDQNVAMWKNQGNSTNPNQVLGKGQLRTLSPISPGLMFRGEKLPAGTHLVTTQSSAQLNMVFNAQGATPSVGGNAIKTVTYLLVPKAAGGFKRIKVEGQELTDLRASSANRSYTIKNGAVEDNAAPGYDQQSLRSAGFIQ